VLAAPIKRKGIMSWIILPNKIDVVVSSYGGVGTTFLLNFLEKYKTTNDSFDRKDRMKHSPLPPISFNINVKFVYVFGNPQLSAISLFQRGFHDYHSMKLQRYFDTNKSPIPKKMTLQEYTSIGVDKFFFQDHFNNWYHKYLPSIPTLFIRYETLFDNLEFLFDFLEIPKARIDTFPREQKRSSNLSDISVETRKQLDVMYGDFSRELSKLDDVEIRQAGNRKIFSMTYLKTHYIRAIATQIPDYSKYLIKKHSPRIFGLLKKLKKLTKWST